MNELLKLLESDCTLTTQQIATMLDMNEADVAAAKEQCEKDGLIIAYQALIDWDKIGEDSVTALIEVKVVPQRGDGFDRIAERIFQYEEVESLYLMSGAYDLTVIVTGDSLKTVAQFVSAKLATIDGVTSTATHFILKKYKEKHKVYYKMPEQEERMMYL